MSDIAFPLKQRQKGASVASLQEALQLLLDQAAILAGDEAARRKLAAALSGERKTRSFGSATQRLVSAFQAERSIEATGQVDERTATALNALVKELKSLPAEFGVPLQRGSEGPDVELVHETLAALGLHVAADERRSRRYGASTAGAVSAWQRERKLSVSGELDLDALKVLWAEGRSAPRNARGVVRLEDGTPAPGLLVVAFDRDFRAEQPLGRATTDRGGRYRIVYTAAAFARAEKGSADLGVRVFAADGKTLLHAPTSRELVMNAPHDAVVDVTVSLPAGAVPGEFERIERELRPLLRDVVPGEVGREPGSDEGNFLARETAIDEERIAHFVVAHRVGELSGVRPDYFYALLREDGLFGIGPGRPRAVQVPVGFQSDTRAVLFEAVLLDSELARAALRRAVRKRIVAPSVEEQAAATAESLLRWREEALTFVREEVPRNVLGLVEELIEADRAGEVLDFLGSLDPADLTGLYERLDGRGAFAAADRPKAETRLRLGELLGFNLGLVEEVTESLGATTPADVRALARLERREWTDLIARGTARVSLGGRPIDPSLARRQSSIIVRRFEKTFPTVAFTAQLARRKPRAVAHHEQIVEFLDTHADFELGTQRLAPFLRSAGVDPAAVAPEVRRGVEKLQRVFQLAGDYRKTEGLLEAGYGAAADVVDAGRSRFVADARGFAGMGRAEANRVFDAAQDINLGAVMVATNLRTLSWPAALEGDSAVSYATRIEKVVAEQPDLKALFGSTDTCECRHCRSIYGPAAYFADVMRFLRNRLVKDTTAPGSASTKAAKTILFKRRPELGEIDLNCENAEVPVPHIDIVCELLEEAVSPDPGFTFVGTVARGKAPAALLTAVRGAGLAIGADAVVYGPYAADRFILRDRGATLAVDGPGPSWRLRRLRQTHGSAEERAAAPEYVNQAAYTVLAGGKAAFGLPFDLFHAETRAFLSAAGIERAALMEALAVGGVPSAEVIAGETLGLSAGERALIFASSATDQPAIWGVPGPTAADAMKTLDLFMRRAELDYRQAERLLAGRYARGGADLFIRHLDSSCTLSRKEIANLDDRVLDRVHRVLRLARKTGLAPRDVDRLASGPKLGNGELGAAALQALAQLVRLSGELSVEVGRLITWLDLIPTDGEPSEHVLLFQNPAATGPLDAGLAPEAIRQNEAAEAAAPSSGRRLSAVQADLALAFGVRPADLGVLMARLADTAVLGPNPPLTFRALAALHGRIGLARALGLRPADLVGLEQLWGDDPLSGAARLRAFAGAARTVEAAGVAIGDLEYLLARRAADLAARELAAAAITPVLQAIRTGLAAAAAANRSPYDDSLTPREQAVAFEALLQRQPGLDAAAVARLLDMVRIEAPDAAAGAAAKEVVDGPLAGLVDGAAVRAAIDAIVAAPVSDAGRKTMLRLVMDGLSTSALRVAAFEVAVAALAAPLRVSVELSAEVARGARLPVGAAATPIIELLTAGPIADETVVLSPATTPDLYRALRLADAVAGLITPFDPSPETVAFMFQNAAALGWLPLDGTPFEPGQPAVALSRWLELADAFALIAEFPAVPRPGQPGQTVSATAVFRLALGGGGKGPLLDALAVLTGWPRALVGDADARLGFSVAAYRTPATWRSLGRAAGFLHTLGVSIAEAVAYTAPVLGEADRGNARRMLRARYAEADWLGALKGIMDPIRERKRDALVAHLLARDPALTEADLYDYFLTDTQWSARMPSSRLVHAHGTLQLFVQRCIAGLEPRATADLDGDSGWGWWEWMRNYRVWEVNRKVFVEPQYYIRPEWRDDKSEPFAEMEGALLQNELNEENINAAFEGYLDRLDQLAFLDVLATCYDLERHDLHVFACTKGGEPRTYFHRVLQRERVWTPWKKVDLDIAGEHLIAFFRNRRLYLAWATFMEKGNEEQEAVFPAPSGSGPQKPPPAERRTEIRLAISEYTGKKWLPRRVSEGALVTPWEILSLDQNRVVLTVTPDPRRFTVDVYLEAAATLLTPLGFFLLTGCKGYPEAVPEPHSQLIGFLPQFLDALPRGQRIVEQGLLPGDELAISGGTGGSGFQTLFGRTPGTFRVTYPYQASEFDRWLGAFFNAALRGVTERFRLAVFGTLMPFFFEDNQRGYCLVPGFYGSFRSKAGPARTAKTFSNVHQLLLDILALVDRYLRLLAAATTEAERQAVLDGLASDEEFAKILAEVASYQGVAYGLVVRNFYHPLACFLRERYFAGGVPALLARETQLAEGAFRFEDPAAGHAPNPIILEPYPKEELEFGRESAYGLYNWELTFHTCHLIASKLIEAERFDEAERWLRYVFDPLGSSNDPAPRRYWNTKPFYQRDPAEYGGQLVTAILDRVARDPAGTVETELADAILEWRRNPFKPYLVARSRTVVFQQAIVDLTVRLYIGRGDQHFRRDQLEDLVMASLDYSRAERLLGPRPKVVPSPVDTPPETYNQLESKLDLFGNALRTLENLLPDVSTLPHGGAELPPLPLTLESLYFCIPPSEKLFELWDTLEERQFNLRNSLTIEGVERTLSLFAPPLSVEALIQAAAAGLSLSAVVASLGAPRPPYRFRVMLRNALECAEAANGLSKALEQALANRDAEGLARLKTEQEVHYLGEQTLMLQEEINAAVQGVETATKTRLMHQETEGFYAGRPYMNGWEVAANVSYGAALALQAVVAVGYAASGALALVPSFMVGGAGFGGSPTVNVQTGGRDYSSSARDFVVGAVGALGAVFDKAGSMLEHQGNYRIRKDDWDNSARTARREAEKADIEITVAGIREKIAREQLRLHLLKRQQTGAEEAYLRTKFTNRELFEWLAQELRGLSRQAFNLAFEAARAAERCFNFELGTTESFIRAGQWNDARRGLLAAEHLLADLRRMDSAYLKRNVRERELTKRLSLARLDPVALLELRTMGRCVIQLPEALFDLEHPGHYFRRIKALTVSVPSVSGPYTAMPVELTQTSNRLRWNTSRKSGATSDADAYAEDPAGDVRFRYNVGSVQSISTSSGDDDSGLFSLDFGDERYLPFEGSGVCGTFVLELPQALRPFDYGTISDVVLNLRYTARHGGGGFRTMVQNGLRERMNVLALKTGRTGLFQAFDLRRDRPDVWHRLVTTGTATLTIGPDDLPYFTKSRAVAVTASRILARVTGHPASYGITVAGAAVTLNAAAEPDLAGLLSSSVMGVALETPVTISTPLPNRLEEMIVVINYTMTS
jgi:peptidoglycan hydrolase-like protein with peptidoglycan-binding domain